MPVLFDITRVPLEKESNAKKVQIRKPVKTPQGMFYSAAETVIHFDSPQLELIDIEEDNHRLVMEFSEQDENATQFLTFLLRLDQLILDNFSEKQVNWLPKKLPRYLIENQYIPCIAENDDDEDENEGVRDGTGNHTFRVGLTLPRKREILNLLHMLKDSDPPEKVRLRLAWEGLLIFRKNLVPVLRVVSLLEGSDTVSQLNLHSLLDSSYREEALKSGNEKSDKSDYNEENGENEEQEILDLLNKTTEK